MKIAALLILRQGSAGDGRGAAPHERLQSFRGMIAAQVCTLIYFSFFLLMPWWSTMGQFKQVPDRVTFHAH